jgi:sulfate/thiosulfate transport system permease protein
VADSKTLDPLRGNRSARVAQRSIALVYLGGLVLVPIVAITWRTIGDGWSAFWSAISSSQAVTAYRLTLEVAVLAVLLNAIFGVGVALLLTRYRFPGRRLLGALCDLPLSVSPIVVGLALVLVYGPVDSWFGSDLQSAGIQIIYSVPGMVLATAFVSLPLVLREIMPVLEEAGTDQEQAARVLGASDWQSFMRITLPTIRPALMYGVVLTFARSIGEYGAVKVVSGNVSGVGQTQTLPLVIGSRVDQLQGGYYQLAFIMIVVTVSAIVIMSFKRREEAR